jgi:hypothetical protein
VEVKKSAQKPMHMLFTDDYATINVSERHVNRKKDPAGMV